MATSLNIFSVDVEEWYHANYDEVGSFPAPDQPTSLEPNLELILNLCDRHDVKGTFFVLGSVAEAKPETVRMIAERGHEVASHGYGHQLVYKQTPEEFEADVRRGRDLLRAITGEPILGYRAPSWSVTKQTPWIYPILKRLDFSYDASVFPVQTFLYGIPDAPRFFYRAPETEGLLEVPTSTVRLFDRNIAFSGGFYFRALPYALIDQGIRMVNRENQPAIVYLHPREIDPDQPRLKLSAKDSLIHYVGIKGAAKKLEKLFQSHRFTSISSYLKTVPQMAPAPEA